MRPQIPVLALLMITLPTQLAQQGCPSSDCTQDSDGDGVCDNVDVCAGSNDALDMDGDGTPDGCDICPSDFTDDSDGDGLCDGAPSMTMQGAPLDRAVLQRGRADLCSVSLQGVVSSPGVDSISLSVRRDGAPARQTTTYLTYDAAGNAAYQIEIPLEAGLFDFEVEASAGAQTLFIRRQVTCGDLVLIQGQSNAVAGDYHAEGLANQSQSHWIRSFGSASTDPNVARDDLVWDIADGQGVHSHAAVGAWGLRMAELMVEQLGVPVALLNGAVGGTSVSQHLRNEANPEDLNTIYGRMLYRARRAGMDTEAAALIWYQGESDGGEWGGSTYVQRFEALKTSWQQDFPAIERIWVFQVRQGCGLDAPGDAQLQLGFWDISGNLLSVVSAEPRTQGDWYLVGARGEAPAGTAYASALFAPMGYGALYFDDAFLGQEGGTNLLVNPGFEASASSADGWANSGADASISGSVARSGQRSLRLDQTGIYQFVVASPGQTYTFDVYGLPEGDFPFTDVRQALADLDARHADIELMSTTGAKGHDGCHFYYAGYRELGERIARRVAPLLSGGGAVSQSVAPAIREVRALDASTLLLTLNDPEALLVVQPGAEASFVVAGALVKAAVATPGRLTLQLDRNTNGSRLSFVGHLGDGPDVLGGLGVGLATGFDLPIVR